MTEAAEAKARVLIEQTNRQLETNLPALLSLADGSGCTIVINILPGHNTATIDFQPPKRKIKLR